MACVSLRRLSITAAEKTLARLWCRLEELGLATPQMDVRFEPNGAVQISLIFADPAQAGRALEGWGDALLGRPPSEVDGTVLSFNQH